LPTSNKQKLKIIPLPQAKNLIGLMNFSFSYAGDDRKALDDINLKVRQGEVLVLCGPSGCGKTTLLRNLKAEISPAGQSCGEIRTSLDSKEIGMVFQNPNIQLVNSTLLQDLALPMENINLSPYTMRKRMAETVSFFGIEKLLHQDTDSLSGGQKQQGALASELMKHPRLLLLDEPISQLDPIAARNFLDTLRHLRDEIGLTVILCEHRLDEVIAIADRIALMQEGRIDYLGTPEEVMRDLWERQDAQAASFIPPIPLCSLTLHPELPVCLKPYQLLTRLEENCPSSRNHRQNKEADNKFIVKEKAVRLKEIFFAYEDAMVLKNLSLDIFGGEFLFLLGGNGSGKSTLLKVIASILYPFSGSCKIASQKIAYMPQDPNLYFLKDNLAAELADSRQIGQIGDAYYQYLLEQLGLADKYLLSKHPYDLSGGEQQKAVLASILLYKPDIILLDEPTKGLDPQAKKIVARLLRESGATVIAATHDIEFAAGNADRCALLFDGEIAVSAPPSAFFKDNRYYTTAINRAMRQVCDRAILYEDVLDLCKKEKPSFLARP